MGYGVGRSIGITFFISSTPRPHAAPKSVGVRIVDSEFVNLNQARAWPNDAERFASRDLSDSELIVSDVGGVDGCSVLLSI